MKGGVIEDFEHADVGENFPAVVIRWKI